MRRHKPEVSAPNPWHVPIAVEDIPEVGKHVDLVAEAQERAGVARMAGLRDLPRLEASFDLSRQGAGGVRVVGRVSATVGQTCVVTLEPLTNEVNEDIELLFVGGDAAGQDASVPGTPDLQEDELEPLIAGIIDLGAVATEFLILGINPYPRKPCTVFESPQEPHPGESPFATLTRLGKESQ